MPNLLDYAFQRPVRHVGIAGLLEQQCGQRTGEPPIAILEGMDPQKHDHAQGDDQQRVGLVVAAMTKIDWWPPEAGPSILDAMEHRAADIPSGQLPVRPMASVPRAWAWLLLLATCLLLVSWVTKAQSPGISEHTLLSSGVERSYLLYLPEGHGGRALPLVFSFHGSGGARIRSLLACELSDVLAAAAPVAGLQYPEGCTTKRAIPLIAFHALDDAVNPYALGEDARPYWRMGVETALDKWRQANGCSLANDDEALSTVVTRYHWSDCAGGAELEFHRSSRGGHTWPGSGQNGANQELDASALIWEFFSRHALAP